MMKYDCKKCLCKDVCSIKVPPSQLLKFECPHFKDRSKFIELPCKLNAELFVVQDNKIYQGVVETIEIFQNGDYLIKLVAGTEKGGLMVGTFYPYMFEKRIFLTLKEAEQALKNRIADVGKKEREKESEANGNI